MPANDVATSVENPARITLEQAVEELAQRCRLPKRQAQIVVLIGRGLRRKSIATKLGISHNTVAEHTARACLKAGVEDREGLVGKIIEVLLEIANR
jgi:DNA-binding NarL/FixJ family response regulator